MIFPRFFAGCILQLLPFALLLYYPFSSRIRLSGARLAGMLTVFLCALSAAFAGICQFCVPHIARENRFFFCNMVFMFFLIPCIILYFIQVKDNCQKKIFLLSFTLTWALILTASVNIISTALSTSDNSDVNLPYSPRALLIILTLSCCVLPFLALLLKFYVVPRLMPLDSQDFRHLDTLSFVLFFILAILLVPMNYAELLDPVPLLFYFALILSILIIYGAVFRMLIQAYESRRTMLVLEQTQHQLQTQNIQYLRIMETVKRERRVRHDMRHHLLFVLSLLDAGKIPEAKDYLLEQLDAVSLKNFDTFCEYPAIDMILGYFSSLAKGSGVHFTASVRIPEKPAISDSDLAVVLGNLLSNAYEASSSDNDRSDPFIEISILSRGNSFVITVDNSFSGKLRMKCGRYLSTKEGHTGIGLDNVRDIAKKYDGDCEFSHDSHAFHVSVILSGGGS